MSTTTLTPTDLHTAVAGQLDAWDRRIRIDIDIDGCRLQLADDTPHGGPARVYAEYITVPEQLRRGGYGTAILTALTGWADRRGVTVHGGISAEYGMTRRTLAGVYRRHGFTVDSRWQILRRPNTTGQEK